MYFPSFGTTEQIRSRKMKFYNIWLQCCLCLVIPGLFAVIILLVEATSTAQTRSDRRKPLSNVQKINVSTALAILRTVQAVLSTLTAFTLKESFQFLQWALISHNGLSYTSLLGLSSTTGVMGMITLISSPISKATSKLWTLLRAFLTILLWVSTIVLFYQTSIVTVYDTANTYKVTAGVGPFNGSYVLPFLEYLKALAPQYPYQVLPYNYFAVAYNLVTTPMYTTLAEPVYCQGDSCFSYLLSGGLEMVTPWTPSGYDQYPLVKIEDVPSIQLDFSVPGVEDFSVDDCSVFGATGTPIGIRLCVADNKELGALQAGLFVCTNGTDNGACKVGIPTPNITATARFFRRQATIVAARSNFSIVDVQDLTSPILFSDIDIPAYRTALGWLFNFTAANIPALSSFAENFAIAKDQLEDPSTYGILSQNFQSILAFPFWLFNANNYGNTALQMQTVISSLPPEFYTEASIVAPYAKLKVNSSMFYVFILLQGMAIIFIWIVLLWVLFGAKAFPILSSFPLFDVAFKARFDVEANQRDVLNSDSFDVMKLVGNSRVILKLD